MLLNLEEFSKKKINDSYSVKYILYNNTKKNRWISNPYKKISMEDLLKTPDVVKGSEYAICFSSFLAEARKNKECNRITYTFKISKHLTTEQCLRWLILAQQNGLLPTYCNLKDVVTYGSIALDYKLCSKNMLYIYLCIARYIAEDANFVINTLILVDKYKVHYLAALILSSQICIRGFGHCFFQARNSYPKVIDKDSIYLSTLIGLKRYLNTGCPSDMDGNFNCSTSVSSLCKIDTIASVKELQEIDNVEKVINTTTDDEALKVIKEVWRK